MIGLEEVVECHFRDERGPEHRPSYQLLCEFDGRSAVF